MSGVLSVTGSPEEPAKVGVPISDLNAGLYASHAILAALLSRVRTLSSALTLLGLVRLQSFCSQV